MDFNEQVQRCGIRIKNSEAPFKVSLIHTALKGSILTYEVAIGCYLFPPLKVLKPNQQSPQKNADKYGEGVERVGAYLFNDGYEVMRYALHEGTLHSVMKDVCLIKLYSAFGIGLSCARPMGFDIILFDDCVEYCREVCFPKKSHLPIPQNLELSPALTVYSKLAKKNVLLPSCMTLIEPKAEITYNYNLEPYNNFFLKFVKGKRKQTSLSPPEKYDFLEELSKNYTTYKVPIELDETLHEKKHYYEYVHFEHEFTEEGGEEEVADETLSLFLHEHSQMGPLQISNSIRAIDDIFQNAHLDSALFATYKRYLKLKLLYVQPETTSFREYEEITDWFMEFGQRNNLSDMHTLIKAKQRLYQSMKYEHSVQLYLQLQEKYEFTEETFKNQHYEKYYEIAQIEKSLALFKVEGFVPPNIHEFNKRLAHLTIYEGNAYAEYFINHFRAWLQNIPEQLPEQQPSSPFYSNKCLISKKQKFGIRTISTLEILALWKCTQKLSAEQAALMIVRLFRVIDRLQLKEEKYSLTMQMMLLLEKYEHLHKIWGEFNNYYLQETIDELPPTILALFYMITVIQGDYSHCNIHDRVGGIQLRKLEDVCHIYDVFLEFREEDRELTLLNEGNRVMGGIQAICDGDDENERVQKPYWESWENRSPLIPVGKPMLLEICAKLHVLLSNPSGKTIHKQILEMNKKLALIG